MWGGAPHNFVWDNLQQETPFVLPGYCDAEVLANPCVLQVLAAVMRRLPGEGLRLGFNGNTKLGGSRTQPVHRDGRHVTPLLTNFVLNCPLCDVDESNGSLEVWLGTHAETGTTETEHRCGKHWRGNVRPDVSEARRRKMPPVRVNTRLGGVILRDATCWHSIPMPVLLGVVPHPRKFQGGVGARPFFLNKKTLASEPLRLA